MAGAPRRSGSQLGPRLCARLGRRDWLLFIRANHRSIATKKWARGEPLPDLRYLERPIDGYVYLPRGGRTVVRMPIGRDQLDSDTSTKRTRDAIPREIAELMATPPLSMDEFFGAATVRMRIGMLIAQAMNTPMRPRRPHKSRQTLIIPMAGKDHETGSYICQNRSTRFPLPRLNARPNYAAVLPLSCAYLAVTPRRTPKQS